MFGYNSVDEYYQDCQIDEKKIMAIRTPTLCLNSDDDAFSPADCKHTRTFYRSSLLLLKLDVTLNS